MNRLIDGHRSLILLCTLLAVMFSAPLEDRESVRAWVYVAGLMVTGLAGAYLLMPDRKWFMVYLGVVVLEVVLELLMIGGVVPDVTTLFACSHEYSLTYVMRVYDDSGALADCVAWGEDPTGVLTLGFANYNPITTESELSTANCSVQ